MTSREHACEVPEIIQPMDMWDKSAMSSGTIIHIPTVWPIDSVWRCPVCYGWWQVEPHTPTPLPNESWRWLGYDRRWARRRRLRARHRGHFEQRFTSVSEFRRQEQSSQRVKEVLEADERVFLQKLHDRNIRSILGMSADAT